MYLNGSFAIGLVIITIAVLIYVEKTQRQKTSVQNELVLFRIYIENGLPLEYIIRKIDIGKMRTATLQLHFKPGKNPHNGMEATKATRISILSQTATPVQIGSNGKGEGPFWWSTPGLAYNYDASGAYVFYDTADIRWGNEVIIWTRPR